MIPVAAAAVAPVDRWRLEAYAGGRWCRTNQRFEKFSIGWAHLTRLQEQSRTCGIQFRLASIPV